VAEAVAAREAKRDRIGSNCMLMVDQRQKTRDVESNRKLGLDIILKGIII
jgi:hypothetical protein